MAVSRIILCFLVFFEFLLICNCGLTLEKTRLKRDLDDDDIILGLKMYESRMSRMQRKIAAQLAIMKKQQNRIQTIQYYLRRKGDDYEKEDLEGKINFETDKAKESMQLPLLDNLVSEVDHQEKWQKGILHALQKENKVMDDIHKRVLDYRPICRDTTTEWKDQASGKIKELSRQYVKCNENELLQRFYLERKSASENQVRYNYRCCRLSMKVDWQKPDDM
ncbi:hypothetical protein ACROYT_G040836 [Oculina patagonica]